MLTIHFAYLEIEIIYIHSFLEFVNRQHPNIKFTYELESDYALPFLDVLVTHDDYTFSTSLYRKKTFTGLYTDFSSLAPTKYKINLVRVLVYRAFHICSSYRNFHEEIVRIKKILTENCFPKSLIDRIIKKFLDRQFRPNPQKRRTIKSPSYFVFLSLGSTVCKSRLG